MKALRLFAQQSIGRMDKTSREIDLYRRHAARALSEGRWNVADIFLDRILEVNPRHTEAWLMKGHVRQHCQNRELEAAGCYRKVITLCGHDLKHPHANRAQQSLSRMVSRWR
jgi:hypothetical protein